MAAHTADLEAARASGLATGFVARPKEYGPGRVSDPAPPGAWDVSGASLVEVARSLFGGPSQP